MWREFLSFLMPLVFPAILIARVPMPQDMLHKIVRIYGTYLSSTEPMSCGDGSSVDGQVKKRIEKFFSRVVGWPNFRAMHPMGMLVVDVDNCHLPMAPQKCLSVLSQAGVSYKQGSSNGMMFNPVVIGGRVAGVEFVSKMPIIVECDFAVALLKMAQVLSAQGIEAIGFFSVYRPSSGYSFHSLGLAADINWFKHRKWKVGVWIKSNFEVNENERTCDYRTRTKRGKIIMDAICELWEKRIFNTIVTPNYNDAHSNHIHVDLRPGDNRFYLR